MATTQEYAKPQRLSNAQAAILQLFQNDLSDEELNELRRVLVQYLFKKAENAAEKAMKEKGKTIEDIERSSDEINEHRGNYLKRIRGEQP